MKLALVHTHLFVCLSVVNAHTLDLWARVTSWTHLASEPWRSVNTSDTKETWVERALKIEHWIRLA